MDASATRLFNAAAKKLGRDKVTNTELAAILGVSQQTINNWITRGVSREGAMLAEQHLGISSTFIRDGLTSYPKIEPPEPMEVREQTYFYWPFRQIRPEQLRKLTLEEIEQLESTMLQNIAHRIIQDKPKAFNSQGERHAT